MKLGGGYQIQSPIKSVNGAKSPPIVPKGTTYFNHFVGVPRDRTPEPAATDIKIDLTLLANRRYPCGPYEYPNDVIVPGMIDDRQST